MSLSVLVMTLNEEINIGACLDSLSWCNDIVVLDSYSSDATVEIARERGARVVQRVFDNYAAQRNFGLKDVQYRNPWLLMLDADERVSRELFEEMTQAVAQADAGVALFRLRRKDYLFGRWIRGSSGYPTWFGRVGRIGRFWVERPINEEYHTDGATASLQGHLQHFPFNKGFAAWIAKHDRYSTMEAELRHANTGPRVSMTGLFGADPGRRRRSLKALLYRVPGRPLLVFTTLYVFRGGILEGRAGLTFCLLRAFYEFMIDCKYAELKRRDRNLPV